MSKLIWTLRQALPLTYRSRYRDADGQAWFDVWVMWFGRVLRHERYALAADGNGGN